jgi:hypothetical protein
MIEAPIVVGANVAVQAYLKAVTFLEGGRCAEGLPPGHNMAAAA